MENLRDTEDLERADGATIDEQALKGDGQAFEEVGITETGPGNTRDPKQPAFSEFNPAQGRNPRGRRFSALNSPLIRESLESD